MEHLISSVATEVAARLIVDYGAKAVKQGFDLVKGAIFGRAVNARHATSPAYSHQQHAPA